MNSNAQPKTDILIVGQGIAGTMLAFELMSRGMNTAEDFVVVDAGLHMGSSCISTGLINPMVFKRMTLSWGSELIDSAWKRYGELAKMLSDSGTRQQLFDPRPIVRIVDEQKLELWQSTTAIAEYLGELGSYSLTADGQKKMGAEILGSGWVDVAGILKRARRLLMERGQLITGVYPRSARDIRCKRTVFATGIQRRFTGIKEHTPLPGEQLPFYPVKGDVLHLQLPDAVIHRTMSAGISIRPLANKHSIYEVGSSYVRDFSDASPDLGGRRWLLQQLASLGFGSERELDDAVISHFAGVRPASRDRLAYVGPIGTETGRVTDKAYIFNGLGTRGVMLAPGLAEMLASELIDEKALPKEILPERAISS